MKHLFIITQLVVFALISNAQTVSTFGTTASNADVAVNTQGFVFVASEGTTIQRFSPTGVLDASPFVNGNTISRASGLAFDPSGDTLYVTCRTLNGQGWISKVDPNGNDQVFSSNLYFPGDISFDASGNIYVTEFNNNIKKITPDGIVTVYVNSPSFNTPIGIAWTPGDTIFVASAHDGNIYKVIPSIPTPTVQWFAHVNGLVQNWACGFMTYSNGNLFITNGDNKIHKIDMNGVVSDYAGTGIAGAADGSFSTAQFEAPNGIGVNSNGTKIFVTEYGKNRVRLLEEGVSGLNNYNNFKEEPIIYPNPFNKETKIKLVLKEQQHAEINIYNIQGRKITTLFSGTLNNGTNEINWNGTDDSDNRLPKGVYICKLQLEQQSLQTKLIIK